MYFINFAIKRGNKLVISPIKNNVNHCFDTLSEAQDYIRSFSFKVHFYSINKIMSNRADYFFYPILSEDSTMVVFLKTKIIDNEKKLIHDLQGFVQINKTFIEQTDSCEFL